MSGIFVYPKNPQRSWGVRLKATPYAKAARQGGFSKSPYTFMSIHKRTIRTLSHCFYDLKYHLVWTPKYRGKVLGQDKIKSELRRIFESICK